MRTIEGRVETIFGDRTTQLVSACDCVQVKFEHAAPRDFSAFAPRTELGILFRNVVTKAMRFSFIADLAIGRSLKDDLVLPDYAA